MDSSRYIAKHVINLPRSGIRDFFEIVATDVQLLGKKNGSKPPADAPVATEPQPTDGLGITDDDVPF